MSSEVRPRIVTLLWSPKRLPQVACRNSPWLSVFIGSLAVGWCIGAFFGWIVATIGEPWGDGRAFLVDLMAAIPAFTAIFAVIVGLGWALAAIVVRSERGFHAVAAMSLAPLPFLPWSTLWVAWACLSNYFSYAYPGEEVPIIDAVDRWLVPTTCFVLPGFILGTMALATWAATTTWRRYPQLVGLCAGCGYDLRGSAASLTCPECGTHIHRQSGRAGCDLRT